MLTLPEIQQKAWFQNLASTQKQLLEQSLYLIESFGNDGRQFYDYSFLVMPASKAYEGFIKDFLFGVNLISEKRYKGTRFRVGKALNPSLAAADPDEFEALFDDLVKLFGSDYIPNQMWDAWKECRNQVFHYFHDFNKAISLFEAKQKVAQVISVIELVTSSYLFQNSNYQPKL